MQIKNINIIAALAILLCYNHSEAQDLMKNLDENRYVAYGIQIEFPYGYHQQSTKAKPKANYLYQAIEVLTFEDFRAEFHPNAQRLMPSEPLLIPDQSIDSLLDLEDVDLDINQPQMQAIQDEPEQEQKITNYAPLQPSFGDLASLYILPKVSDKEIKKAVNKYVQDLDVFQLTKVLESIKIGEHKVWKWRYQAGKSRYDHFLLIGDTYNYLFVSSAYSAGNGGLEKIIQNLKID